MTGTARRCLAPDVKHEKAALVAMWRSSILPGCSNESIAGMAQAFRGCLRWTQATIKKQMQSVHQTVYLPSKAWTRSASASAWRTFVRRSKMIPYTPPWLYKTVKRLSFIDPRTQCEQSSIIFERCPMSFELRSISADRVTVAKPSGLGMVSCSQHAAGCAAEPRKRPAAVRFIAGPRRAVACYGRRESLADLLFSLPLTVRFSVTERNDIAPDTGKKCCTSAKRSVGSYVWTPNGVVPRLRRSSVVVYESTCCSNPSVWRSFGVVSISDYGSEYCGNRGKSHIEFTPEFVRM